MNDATPIDTGTALALPASTDLVSLFKAENGLDPIISQLEIAAREEAQGYSADTTKGRKALRSLAATISSKKAELDRNGKALTEAQREEIKAVNAGRTLAETRLAALRDEIKKPAEDWDIADKARKDRLQAMVDGLSKGEVDQFWKASDIAIELDRIAAITIDATWEEFEGAAHEAKDATLKDLMAIHDAAETREANDAELAKLRADAAAREESDRIAAAKAEVERIDAEHIETARIAAALAAKEAARKLIADEAAAKERAALEAAQEAARQVEAAKVETARVEREALAIEQAAERERQAAADREREAADRHARELAQAETDRIAAVQAERDRIAAQQQADREVKAAREANQAHRDKIAKQITAAIRGLEVAGNLDPEDVAAALMANEIPHVEVTL